MSQHLVGSLAEFIDVPKERSLIRIKAVSSEAARADARPANRRRFDLEEHVKNHSNATILEAKRRHELLTEQEKPPTRHRSIEVESVVNRLNKTDRSFFVKPETKADPINKQTLNKKHLLLKSIIRTQEEQNKFKGSSIYDESFKRLYNGLEKVFMQPIADRQRLVIDDSNVLFDSVRHPKNEFERKKARIPAKLRLRLQNGRQWARTHHKSCSYYNRQLDVVQDLEKVKQPQKRGDIIGSIRQLLK